MERRHTELVQRLQKQMAERAEERRRGHTVEEKATSPHLLDGKLSHLELPHNRPSEALRSEAPLVEADELEEEKTMTQSQQMESDSSEPLWYVWLDCAAAAAILLNLLVAAIEFQYDSFDLFCTLEVASPCRSSEQVWPFAEGMFANLEYVFGACLIVELLVRLIFRVNLWKDRWWLALDFSFTALWVIERMELFSAFDPTLLRAVRLVRLLRLMRMVSKYTIFDSLILIAKSIQSCVSVLLWTFLLLLLLMLIVSMVNTTILKSFIADTSQDTEARRLVFENWGSFVRAFVSMFEITLANWGPQCWLLMNRVHVGWGFFFIAYRCCFGFAVIQVITSVFIQHTFKVAGRDEEVMIKEKEKASKAIVRHLNNLFAEMDDSGDGLISREEFEAAMKKDRVKNWLGALEISLHDVPRIFRMLDDGDGTVSRDEFVGGLKRLKGNALSIDLFALSKEVQRLKSIVTIIKEPVHQV